MNATRRRRTPLVRLAWLALACAASSAVPALASSRYDPRLRFRTISTPRFDIHFHQGEESTARRLARLAEEVAAALDATLGAASGRVQVVLVNQTDIPNGWATPVPYNLIEIAAAAPGGASQIGNTDDWLRLVFTHEYTHIVHLGRSAGWSGGLRRVFGRHPALFPNATLPLWAIEGVATFEESHQTGAGRVAAGDVRQILTSAAAVGRFEPLDRASGGLDDWPAGNAQYAYGGFFHRFLADRYGPSSLRQLTDETARRLPYFGTGAFRKVYGRSLGRLWSDFGGSFDPAPAVAAGGASQVTFHGFTVRGPRFGPGGRLYYSVVNPHGFPALMALDPGSSEPTRITTRYLGERVAVAGSWLVFDQTEIQANVGLQSDLFAFSTVTGETTRLTRGWRAADPDLSPDGRTLVFTTQRADRRELSTAGLQLAARPVADPATVLVSEPGTDFTAPRWSPDGRFIAVERRVRGTMPGIVIVDVMAGTIRTVMAEANARNVSPAWLPDGNRLLFASTRDDGAFRLFALDLRTGDLSRLENSGPSAESVDVSADGRTLVFVGYTPAGYDLFTLPIDAARWTPVVNARPGPDLPTQPGASEPDPAGDPERHYTPWPTLAPRAWTPVIESGNGETTVGAGVAGADALGRHAYAATVGWAISRGPGGSGPSTSRRPHWQAAYAYDRWWPTLFLDASDDTDPYRTGSARSREVNAGALFPWRRVRWSQSLFAAVHAATDSLDCASCAPPVRGRAERRALRTGWAYTSAKSYGYSISREEGWSLRTTTELVRQALGSDGNAGAAVVDLRGYRRVASRHGVVAGRLAAARAWGDDTVRRDFTASGDGPAQSGFAFDYDAVSLLRGFDADVRGRSAAVVNVDFRAPLKRIERGRGTWPAFARVVHGAVFVDAGHAWSGSFRGADLRVSSGVELSLDAVLAYVVPVTLTAGAAWRHDPQHEARGPALFARIGRAF